MEEKQMDTPKKSSSSLKGLLILSLILVVGFAVFITESGDLAAIELTQTPALSDTNVNVSENEEFAVTQEEKTLEIEYDKLLGLHDSDEIVYKSGNQEISWEDYSYFYQAVVQENIYYVDPAVDFTDEVPGAGMSYNDFFAASAEDTLDYYVSMIDMAKENGVTEDDVKDDIALLEKSYLTNYDVETAEDLYKLLGEQYGVSKNVYNLINNATVYSNKLFANLYGANYEKVDKDEALEMIKEKNYMNVQHILLSCYDMATYEKLDDQAYGVKKAKAQEIADEINKVVDNEERAKKFEELAVQYNEDGNSKYCFTEGTMVQTFEDAAKALDEYEVTVIETEYGAHILMRLPLTADTVLLDQEMTPVEVLANNKFLEAMQLFRDSMKSERVNNFEVPDLNNYRK